MLGNKSRVWGNALPIQTSKVAGEWLKAEHQMEGRLGLVSSRWLGGVLIWRRLCCSWSSGLHFVWCWQWSSTKVSSEWHPHYWVLPSDIVIQTCCLFIITLLVKLYRNSAKLLAYPGIYEGISSVEHIVPTLLWLIRKYSLNFM